MHPQGQERPSLVGEDPTRDFLRSARSVIIIADGHDLKFEAPRHVDAKRETQGGV